MAHLGWKQVWNNGKYAVSLYIAYEQNIVNNTTTVTITNERCCSLDAYHYFHYTNVNNGYQFSGGEKYDVFADVQVNAGSCWQFPQDHNINKTFTHDANGNPPTMTVYAQWITGLNQYDTPEFDWIPYNIPDIPRIDRSGGVSSISVDSVTDTSITINVGSNVLTTVASYRLNDGKWVNVSTPSSMQVTGGGTGKYIISGLSPNTSYKIGWCHQRDYNKVWSSEVTTTTKTNKPDAPKNGAINISSVSHNSVTASFSGFTYDTNSKFSYYNVAIFESGTTPSYTKITNSSYTFSNLKSNTAYTVRVVAYDNYGSASSPIDKSVTTWKSPITISSFEVTGITHNSLTTKATVTTNNNTITEVVHKIVGGSSVTNTEYANHTYTDLNPNTEYSLEETITDSYGRSVKSTTTGTTLPNPPVISGVTNSSITHNSATITVKAVVSSPGTITRYELITDSETLINTTGVFNVTDLNPNTEYSYTARAIDNYSRTVTKSGSLKTLPSLPSPSVTITSTEEDTCNIKINPGIGTGATLETITYRIGDTGSIVDIGTNTTAIVDISNLEEESSFTINVSVLDNYGRKGTASTTGTVPSRSFMYIVNSDGSVVRCESYIIDSSGTVTKLSKATNTSVIE